MARNNIFFLEAKKIFKHKNDKPSNERESVNVVRSVKDFPPLPPNKKNLVKDIPRRRIKEDSSKLDV